MTAGHRSRVRGSLLAGAVGDALGAPVEFLTLDQIRERHGNQGVADFVPPFGADAGAVTDDTQMTLFTAEGLLRTLVRDTHYGMADAVGIVHRAYLRWLTTQGEEWPTGATVGPVLGGWLVTVDALHHRREPGLTCLSALRDGRRGSVANPLNNSKGCGAVMRSAPFGLIGLTTPTPFDLAVDCAALTHGHPDGYLPAGFLAALVAGLADGRTLDDALDQATAQLRECTHHEATMRAVERARHEASTGFEASPERVESLGAGWVGEEALAIAIYCALVTDDVRSSLLLAVNHSGDSDSTGSITGNIMGTIMGEEGIPTDLLTRLELRQVITRLADDLVDGYFGGAAGDEHLPTTAQIESFIRLYPGS